MERIRGACAMGRRIGQRPDDLELFDDRSGPAVRHDQRQRVCMFGFHVNELNVEPIDRGDEHRQRVESGLTLAPVVIGRPIGRKPLEHFQRHALRVIVDGFAVGPSRRLDALTHIVDLRVRKLHMKGTNRGIAGGRLCNFIHGGPFSKTRETEWTGNSGGCRGTDKAAAIKDDIFRHGVNVANARGGV